MTGFFFPQKEFLVESEQKYLKRATPSICITYMLAALIAPLLVLWIANMVFNQMFSRGIWPLEVTFIFIFALLYNGCTDRVSFFGVPLAVCESLGLAIAFCIFFWPLPLSVFFLAWFGFGIVSYFAVLVRITRLKKKGYVIHPTATE